MGVPGGIPGQVQDAIEQIAQSRAAQDLMFGATPPEPQTAQLTAPEAVPTHPAVDQLRQNMMQGEPDFSSSRHPEIEQLLTQIGEDPSDWAAAGRLIMLQDWAKEEVGRKRSQYQSRTGRMQAESYGLQALTQREGFEQKQADRPFLQEQARYEAETERRDKAGRRRIDAARAATANLQAQAALFKQRLEQKKFEQADPIKDIENRLLEKATDAWLDLATAGRGASARIRGTGAAGTGPARGELSQRDILTGREGRMKGLERAKMGPLTPEEVAGAEQDFLRSVEMARRVVPAKAGPEAAAGVPTLQEFLGAFMDSISATRPELFQDRARAQETKQREAAGVPLTTPTQPAAQGGQPFSLPGVPAFEDPLQRAANRIESEHNMIREGVPPEQLDDPHVETYVSQYRLGEAAKPGAPFFGNATGVGVLQKIAPTMLGHVVPAYLFPALDMLYNAKDIKDFEGYMQHMAPEERDLAIEVMNFYNAQTDASIGPSLFDFSGSFLEGAGTPWYTAYSTAQDFSKAGGVAGLLAKMQEWAINQDDRWHNLAQRLVGLGRESAAQWLTMYNPQAAQAAGLEAKKQATIKQFDRLDAMAGRGPALKRSMSR